jgi:hypothetical protein
MTDARVPKNLWILMYRCTDGRYLPSMDHFCGWSTRKAARWKIKQIGAAPGAYREFKYVSEPRNP